ncbi:MAG: TolC family protein [Burkholderiales bacterium]|nr:TolC family protein [Burkholderiales bacterium]
MATEHSSAASAASVRRRTHAIYIICALLIAAWPPAAPAQSTPPSLTDQRGRQSLSTDLYDSRKVPAPVPELESSMAHEAAVLTLGNALALALRRNPELAAFGKERYAVEGALLQAGALPNPVLDIIGDNLGNERKAQAGDRSTAIQIGQLIELGGKRAARIRAAEASHELASWDYEAKRIEILSLVAQRFVDVLAAQQRQTLAEDAVALSRQVSDAVAKRVQAGKVSPVEETKARLTQAGAEVELEQARREAIAARDALGALWANPNPSFEKAVGDLEKTASLPAFELLVRRVRDNPELARWSSEIERRRAGVDAEKAKAVPDVTVTAGVARFSQFDDHAYMVGISLPLPLFNRNQGGILEASRRLDKAGDELRAAKNRVLTELTRTYQRLAAIDKEIGMLRTILLPGAQSAFEAASKGYQLGKFGFLDVLDAQRTLFQSRTQHLHALADYQRGVSDLERLIGGSLESSAAPASQK